MKRLLAVLGIALAALAVPLPVAAQAPAKPDLIEVIEVKGVINAYAATAVKDAVEKINETPKVKGVLLVVDSPGGGASASAVLYQEISKIKVPVVGYCEYVCGSGGAYILMAPSVKYIAVRDDTIGGSIGVIMQSTRFNRLLDKLKIDNQTFKSGQFKDAGNPTRASTDADTAYLQGIVDTLAQKFYGVVAKSRPKLTEAQWAEIKAAKIFIGDGVVKVGLADAVMSRDEATAKVKELAKAKNAFTREELSKIVKNASEAAGMKPVMPEIGALDRGLAHVDTLMGLLADVRRGESVTFQYLMPYTF